MLKVKTNNRNRVINVFVPSTVSLSDCRKSVLCGPDHIMSVTLSQTSALALAVCALYSALQEG